MAGDGGPAYPIVNLIVPVPGHFTATPAASPGMSLRAWLTGMAVNGMLAADGNDPRWTGKDTGPDHQRGGGKWIDPAGVARQAVEIADAMLVALELS